MYLKGSANCVEQKENKAEGSHEQELAEKALILGSWTCARSNVKLLADASNMQSSVLLSPILRVLRQSFAIILDRGILIMGETCPGEGESRERSADPL